MVNPRVLLRADLPLELSKVRENQRVERKRARKLLHRPAVLRDRVILRETTAPERSGASRFVYGSGSYWYAVKFIDATTVFFAPLK